MLKNSQPIKQHMQQFKYRASSFKLILDKKKIT